MLKALFKLFFRIVELIVVVVGLIIIIFGL